MRHRILAVLAAEVVLFVWAVQGQAATIHATFNNTSGETWDSVRQGVVNQAIQDWQSVIADNQTINVTFDFTKVGRDPGGYLGEWSGTGSLAVGTNIYPWTSGISHTIHFNADFFTGTNYLWWDLTPGTSGDQPSGTWDALSVARHELGHMMGFSQGFYVDHFAQPSEVDKWSSHITGGYFDGNGLHVRMESDLSHMFDNGAEPRDLMVPALDAGYRRPISATDLSMLQLAYGYTVVPEPSTVAMLLSLGLLGLATVARKRYRRL